MKNNTMIDKSDILLLLKQFRELGIENQIDYDKFYLYSIITHSTAIEGSTLTEIENQLLFDEGIPAAGRSMVEQMMNLDLKNAYERALAMARSGEEISYNGDLISCLQSYIKNIRDSILRH